MNCLSTNIDRYNFKPDVYICEQVKYILLTWVLVYLEGICHCDRQLLHHNNVLCPYYLKDKTGNPDVINVSASSAAWLPQMWQTSCCLGVTGCLMVEALTHF